MAQAGGLPTFANLVTNGKTAPKAAIAGQFRSLIVFVRRSDLTAEDGVIDGGVDQHQREDEEAFAPEHEGEARVRRRRLPGSPEISTTRPSPAFAWRQCRSS